MVVSSLSLVALFLLVFNPVQSEMFCTKEYVVSANQKNYTIMLNSPLGAGIDMRVIQMIDHAEEYVYAAKKAGINVINVGLMDYDDKIAESLEPFIYECNKEGIDVGVSLYALPQLEGKSLGMSQKIKPMSHWEKSVRLLAKYDGEQIHEISKTGKRYRIKVKYFTCGDELVDNYENYGWSIQDCLLYSKMFYNLIKAGNPRNIIRSSANNHYVSSFYDILLKTELEDGTKYVNTFDYLYLDPYTAPEEREKYKKQLIDVFEKNSCPVSEKGYYDVCGYNLWEYTDEEAANKTIRSYILSLSEGAETFAVFRLVNYFFGYSKSAFYGLLYPSVGNTRLSLKLNDKNKSCLSYGDASKHIYVGYAVDKSFKHYSPFILDKEVSSNLKKYGLVIDGDDCAINKITWGKSYSSDNGDILLWSGMKDISHINNLIVETASFKRIENSGYLKIYHTNVRVDNAVGKITPTAAYHKLAALSQLLGKGCSRPEVEVIDKKIYIAHWITRNRKRVYAIWSLGPQKVEINFKGPNGKLYDDYMNLITIKENRILIDEGVKYIVGPKKLKIKIFSNN